MFDGVWIVVLTKGGKRNRWEYLGTLLIVLIEGESVDRGRENRVNNRKESREDDCGRLV
jgi:hypothetical protein